MSIKTARLAKIAEIAQKVQLAGSAYERMSATEKSQQRVPSSWLCLKQQDSAAARQKEIELNKPYGV
jgi:hypothetical protein